MSKPYPTDARDLPLQVGDFVCYTTNSRESGLSFGHIDKIYEKVVTRYTYDAATGSRTSYQDIDFSIRMAETDSFGTTKYQQKFDRISGKYVQTDKPVKSGIVQHSKYKFLKL